MKNLLVAQSGGPTSAINATLLGVIQKGMISKKIEKIYGGIYGIKGILNENIIELNDIFANPENMMLLENTPASALGSCRFKLRNDDDELETIIKIFRKYNIGYFIYIGGNDSMDTVFKIAKYCDKKGIDDIKVMGAPKTIDNDLYGIDHAPGFGSAAKYIATTMTEIFADLEIYDIPCVTIIEIMGRDAGWLTASSSLSGINNELTKPHFIYLPEVIFDEDKFLKDIKSQLSKTPFVVACVSEGLKNGDGVYICSKNENKVKDNFGHIALSGTAKYLELLVKDNIGCKVRSVELNIIQRCAAHLTSLTDIEEAKILGYAALNYALNGETGKMSTLTRISNNPYEIKISSINLEEVANHERKVPRNWINKEGNNVNEDMIDYLKPLIKGECKVKYVNGIPLHIKLH